MASRDFNRSENVLAVQPASCRSNCVLAWAHSLLVAELTLCWVVHMDKGALLRSTTTSGMARSPYASWKEAHHHIAVKLLLQEFAPLTNHDEPQRRSLIREVSGDHVIISFDLSTARQYEALMSILLIIFIIMVMCVFGLVIPCCDRLKRRAQGPVKTPGN
eukprot:4240387-Amphidinium_carterae.2